MKNTRRIAYGGVICAISIALMLLSAVFPFAEYACPALAGIVLIALVLEFNKKTAYIAYASVSILSLIIVPNREAAIIFVAFMGYYPIIKSSLEHLKSHKIEWMLKILLFNISAAIGYAVIIFVFQITELLDELNYAFIYAAVFVLLANIAFVLYDITLTKLIFLYQDKIMPRVKKAILK